MPNWNSVLKEISGLNARSQAAFDIVRRKYLKRLHRHTGRTVIAYYSGFLTKPRVDGIDIRDEDKNGLMLCAHETERHKGLDLILHTPGGDSQATISIVDYLRQMYGTDIRAIIPQIAMSAGTMIACSCREIIMGKQSSLGPIDPQFGVIAVANLLAEVRKAREEIKADPSMAMFWSPILSQITPSFLERCEWAQRDSNEFLEKTLRDNMLSALPPAQQTGVIEKIARIFGNSDGRAHNTHFQLQECLDAGLKVARLEDDPKFQDLILTIHHCYMHTLSNTGAFKIVENHKGRAMVRTITTQLIPMPVAPAMEPAGAEAGDG